MSKPKPTRRKIKIESHKAGKIPADALKVLRMKLGLSVKP